jgi:hypothetical protein
MKALVSRGSDPNSTLVIHWRAYYVVFFCFQVITYLDEILTKYNDAKNEKHSEQSGRNLMYHYVCGNLSSYLFSSQVNASHQKSSTLQTALRNFEDSLTEELFLRRNKQFARKIIQEINKPERKRKKRRMFFAIGAGNFNLYNYAFIHMHFQPERQKGMFCH